MTYFNFPSVAAQKFSEGLKCTLLVNSFLPHLQSSRFFFGTLVGNDEGDIEEGHHVGKSLLKHIHQQARGNPDVAMLLWMNPLVPYNTARRPDW